MKNKAYISEDKITQKLSTQKERNETNRQIGIKNRQVELKSRQIIEKRQMNGERKPILIPTDMLCFLSTLHRLSTTQIHIQ
jgi:hypothetical protein